MPEQSPSACGRRPSASEAPPQAYLGHASGRRAAPQHEGLNFLPSAPGRGRPHPSIASDPTRKYPLFVIASFAAAANRKSRSATVLYSDQWPSGGGGSCPRFSLSRTAKIEFALTLSASNFIRRNSISAFLSQSAVDLEPVPKPKPRVATDPMGRWIATNALAE